MTKLYVNDEITLFDGNFYFSHFFIGLILGSDPELDPDTEPDRKDMETGSGSEIYHSDP